MPTVNQTVDQPANVARPHGTGLLRVEAAASYLGLGTRTFQRYDVDGTIGPKPRKVGSMRMWSVAELDAWIAADCPHRNRWEAAATQRAAG